MNLMPSVEDFQFPYKIKVVKIIFICFKLAQKKPAKAGL